MTNHCAPTCQTGPDSPPRAPETGQQPARPPQRSSIRTTCAPIHRRRAAPRGAVDRRWPREGELVAIRVAAIPVIVLVCAAVAAISSQPGRFRVSRASRTRLTASTSTCLGGGSPVVVLEAGLGGGHFDGMPCSPNSRRRPGMQLRPGRTWIPARAEAGRRRRRRGRGSAHAALGGECRRALRPGRTLPGACSFRSSPPSPPPR